MKHNAKKVFISYSHDSEAHKEKILKFSNQLRDDGIDAVIDQYDRDPEEGWVLWMLEKVKNSDYVLVICTEKYYKKVFDSNNGIGKGTKWESKIILGELYHSEGRSSKFKPVILNDSDEKWIPDILNQYTYYHIDRDYNSLYNEILQRNEKTKPALGKLKTLKAKSEGIPKEIDQKEYNFLFNDHRDFNPQEKSERVISNLLVLDNFPTQLFSADTDIRTLRKLWSIQNELNFKKDSPLLLKDKKIYGFQDLRDSPWDKICDAGTCDPISTNSYLFGDNVKNRDLIYELFYLTLKDFLYKKGIKYSAKDKIYYLFNFDSKSERKLKYDSLKERASQVTVVKELNRKGDNIYFRHHAFMGYFKSYVDKVYLEITPTYYYSINGIKPDRYREEKLKKLKQLERHVSVRNHLLLWEDIISKNDLGSHDNLFKFGKLKRFILDKGIYDEEWRKSSKTKSENIIPDQIRLFD